MAGKYKITKYRGKHTIKDTKTGESHEIDIAKYMTGGEKDKKKKLSEQEVDEINEKGNVEFTVDGANSIFERIEDQDFTEELNKFDLGKYKGVDYFNVGYNDGVYNISPTSKNPGNASKYKDYLAYLQKQNPDLKVNRRGSDNGYLPFAKRLEYGGMLDKYDLGGETCLEGYMKDSTGKCVPTITQGFESRFTGQKDTSPKNYEGLGPLAYNPENTDIKTEGNREQLQKVKGLSAGLHEMKPNNEIVSSDISNELKNQMISKEEQTKKDTNYNMPNLYAGVDIPTAAYTLGQSIKNKDTLGIVAGGLKVATGLGRNLVSGLGQANRENQVMKDAYGNLREDQYAYARDGGQLQNLKYGGKKDEEMATGEYMRGEENENTEGVNAEIEDGEYLQTNQGDIAEVVGKKHSQGGEKIQMQEEDRVLSDHLKLGRDKAKELSKKYDLDLGAKDTYSKVLDKYRTKSKLNKVIEEEAEIIKKIDEQKNVKDETTRNFNLKVLAEKKAEVESKKAPLEDFRKEMFDNLYNIQEESKGTKEQNNLEDGGNLESLAKEYNIPIERARELVQSFKTGGELPKYVEGGIKVGDIDPKTGQKVTREEARKRVQSGEWEDLGGGEYLRRGESARTETTKVTGVTDAQVWAQNKDDVQGKYGTFEKYRAAADAYRNRNIAATEDKRYYTEGDTVDSIKRGLVEMSPDNKIVTEGISQSKQTSTLENEDELILNEDKIRQRNRIGAMLFPNEDPLAPKGLQGTIKPEARWDRVSPNEIDVRPYLQSIRDREASQIQNLEGLSPNVRAAVLANVRANSQNQESQVRNQIDTTNLGSQEKAEYTNAQTQRQEQNQNNNYRQGYENRIYQAQANTDFDIDNYFNKLQSINKSRFKDIHDLNLINNSQEDFYFDGTGFKRKNTDEEIIKSYRKSKGI